MRGPCLQCPVLDHGPRNRRINAYRASKLAELVQQNRLNHMEHGYSGMGRHRADVGPQLVKERMEARHVGVSPTFYLGANTTVVLKRLRCLFQIHPNQTHPPHVYRCFVPSPRAGANAFLCPCP